MFDEFLFHIHTGALSSRERDKPSKRKSMHERENGWVDRWYIHGKQLSMRLVSQINFS